MRDIVAAKENEAFNPKTTGKKTSKKSDKKKVLIRLAFYFSRIYDHSK